jgi:segregation and condensation protein A
VSSAFFENSTNGYQVFTEVYEGPLDLLLDLIERAELDITRLALAQVTDQYLNYLHQLQQRNAEEVSLFVVIAAKLLQIKSSALLPRQSIELGSDEEEDPGEALARQLIIYKRFKELGTYLEERNLKGLRTFIRVAPPPKIAVKLDMSNVTFEDFLQAAREAFALKRALKPLSQVVSLPRVTIRERIHHILLKIKEFGTTTFRIVLSNEKNRIDIVVTFLAMLELIKRRYIAVQQTTLFGDISIEKSEEFAENENIDIEFED